MAVAKDHKLGGFRQQRCEKCILPWFWRPEVPNQFHWAEVTASAEPRFLCSPRGEPVSASGGCQQSLACGHKPPVSVSVVTLPLV